MKAANSQQIGISLSGFAFTKKNKKKTFPGTMLNVTTVLIIHHYMISNVSCSVNITDCVCLWKCCKNCKLML